MSHEMTPEIAEVLRQKFARFFSLEVVAHVTKEWFSTKFTVMSPSGIKMVEIVMNTGDGKHKIGATKHIIADILSIEL